MALWSVDNCLAKVVLEEERVENSIRTCTLVVDDNRLKSQVYENTVNGHAFLGELKSCKAEQAIQFFPKHELATPNVPVSNFDNPECPSANCSAIYMWEIGSDCSSRYDWIIPSMFSVGPVGHRRVCNEFLLQRRALGDTFRVREQNQIVWGERYIALVGCYLFEFPSRRAMFPSGFLPLTECQSHIDEAGQVVVVFPDIRASVDNEVCTKKLVLRSDSGSGNVLNSPELSLHHLWVKTIQANRECGLSDMYSFFDDRSSLIGKGRCSRVYKVRRRGSRSLLAVKIVDKHEYWDLVSKNEERCDAIAREIMIQTYVTKTMADTHAEFGTVRVLGLFETHGNFVIELELMDPVNFHQLLLQNQRLSESRAAAVVAGLVAIVSNLVTCNIIHRDIKLANLVLTRGNQPPLQSRSCSELRASVRLLDFGFASTVDKTSHMVSGRCGTPGFVAPEILKGSPGEEYSISADMFSVGVVTYALLSGCMPFRGRDTLDILCANKRCDFSLHNKHWSHISSDAKDFIKKLLTVSPDSRMSAKQALCHPWLTRGRARPSEQCTIC
mmetsp:Transcript_11628/g.18922  ORF Transcript_11628/g.18922 Transcript_11628/m.18922 type:complete len:556 (+) Transcript_11628:660-2327(+)